MSDTDNNRLLDLSSAIVSAHVANNALPADSIPDLIKTIYRTLATLEAVPVEPDALVPAVPIKKSVYPDYIVCLEDGRKLKMLKRHLSTAYGMTPNEYRKRWNLPSNYPMVAPDYAARRSSLAVQIGLGRKPATPAYAREPQSTRVALGVSSKKKTPKKKSAEA